VGFEDYWYVIAESRELTPRDVLARRVLDRCLACFRGADGMPAVLDDRCLHRNAPLSMGRVEAGELACAYHGWRYDGRGRVTAIPSMDVRDIGLRCSRPYPVVEREGYVYARLRHDAPAGIAPFPMPHHGEPGWGHVRLQSRFANNVDNCVENFIDIPHTAFVHRGIFRSTRGERIAARVVREGGKVHVDYRNERRNLGTWSWLLNPRGREIRHTDSFFAPNVTSVVYEMGARTFIITSQSVPVREDETLVYTDLTYRFGALNAWAAPFVRREGRRIIDQDLEILAAQMEVIRRQGRHFQDTPADAIHRLVDTIRQAIARGDDPCDLPRLQHDIELVV
jgi:phenylpropionate dioxygenase-like ring-hydroxylating dioxygenase large terminal subunit